MPASSPLPSLKLLPLEPEEVVHRFLERWLRELDALVTGYDDSEMIALIHDSRVLFFRYMDDAEKETFSRAVRHYVDAGGGLLPQAVEFSGILFKYLPEAARDLLFDSIIGKTEVLSCSYRGIVALLTFIKYANRVCSGRQGSVLQAVLEKLRACSDPVIEDTVRYAGYNLARSFSPRKADVLFLIPELLSGSSFLQPPLCALFTIQQLEEQGISADLLDNRVFHYGIGQLTELIGDRYRYLIVTSTPVDQFQNYFIDHRFLIFARTFEAVRKHCRYEKIIAVGSHGTVSPEMLLRDIRPDILVQGEYDRILPGLIAACRDGHPETAPEGVLFREGERLVPSRGKPAEDTWRQSVLRFDRLDLEDYFGYRYVGDTHVKERRWGILQASRGCPCHCTFCFNLYGHQVRHKPVAAIVAEMEELARAGCRNIFFIDQTFTVDVAYTRTLCREIVRRGIAVPWQCETRVDLVDDETVRLMKQAGCTAVWLGIESFDEKVLERSRKGYKPQQLQECMAVLDRNGMEYRAFIMIGMEGDTRESLGKTVRTIREQRIKLSKSIIQCTPRPGTPYYGHLPGEVTRKITHFWQIDALKGFAQNDLDEQFVNAMVEELIKLSNRH